MKPEQSENIRNILVQRFKNPVQVRFKVLEVMENDPWLTIRTAVMSPPTATDPSKIRFFILRRHDSDLYFWHELEEAGLDAFDPETRLFKSQKGKFTLSIPDRWYVVKAQGPMAGLAADSAMIIAPDIESYVLAGVVQMPIKMGNTDREICQKAAQMDATAIQHLVTNHKIVHQGPVTIAGKDCYVISSEFEAEGDRYHRSQYYMNVDSMIYFFVCDAINADSPETLDASFSQIVQSFQFIPLEPGTSLQEAMASEQAEGSVTGRVYTSTEYNCFIAAPEGWEIRTSSNPAHLVEMQYTQGKSIARLIAAPGVKASDLDDVFSKRLESVKNIVQDFNESARRDVTLHGSRGIESIHSYSLEPLGRFHVKEVTVIHNDVYYLILCQCIEPDDFEVMEKDFDQMIESFGFIEN